MDQKSSYWPLSSVSSTHDEISVCENNPDPKSSDTPPPLPTPDIDAEVPADEMKKDVSIADTPLQSLSSCEVQAPIEAVAMEYRNDTIVLKPRPDFGKNRKSIREMDVALRQLRLFCDFATAYVNKQVKDKINAGDLSAEDTAACERYHRECQWRFWNSPDDGIAFRNGLFKCCSGSTLREHSYTLAEFDPVRDLSKALAIELGGVGSNEALYNQLVHFIKCDDLAGRFKPEQAGSLLFYALPAGGVQYVKLLGARVMFDVYTLIVKLKYDHSTVNVIVCSGADIKCELSWEFSPGQEAKLQAFVDKENGIIEEIPNSAVTTRESLRAKLNAPSQENTALQNKRKGKHSERNKRQRSTRASRPRTGSSVGEDNFVSDDMRGTHTPGTPSGSPMLRTSDTKPCELQKEGKQGHQQPVEKDTKPTKAKRVTKLAQNTTKRGTRRLESGNARRSARIQKIDSESEDTEELELEDKKCTRGINTEGFTAEELETAEWALENCWKV